MVVIRRSIVQASVALVLGWAVACVGLGLHYGWWLALVGYGIAGVVFGCIALLGELASAYFIRDAADGEGSPEASASTVTET